MAAAMLLACSGYAQQDTTGNNKPDTIHVGNFIIIKKNKNARNTNNNNNNDNDTMNNNTDNDDDHNINIHIGSNKHSHSNIQTNWLIFDLGFANYRDETDYATANTDPYLHPGTKPFTKDDFKLRTVKSSNVNIWLFMQKVNITKHVLNLKYGLGYEMYNFRYQTNLSYNNGTPSFIYRDSVLFSKNKLFAGYATIPFMLNVNTSPEHKHGFSFSVGVSAGYLLGARNKQISDERGKVKIKGDLDLDKWRLAYIAEAGLGPVHLYGSYSMNPLHENALKQYPYAIGIRFSNF